jgi:hypothetical protein
MHGGNEKLLQNFGWKITWEANGRIIYRISGRIRRVDIDRIPPAQYRVHWRVSVNTLVCSTFGFCKSRIFLDLLNTSD